MAATSPASKAAASARPAWLDRGATHRLDRMPLFGEAMVAVAAAWTDALSALCGAPATFAFEGLADDRVSALPLRRGPSPSFALLEAPGWSTAVGLRFDRAFATALVEAMFGGSEGEDGSPADGPLSAVETRIAEVAMAQAAEALGLGFATVLPSGFTFVRLLAKPDLACLGRPNTSVVVATLRLDTLGRSGIIDLLVPRSALDGFSERLAVVPGDEPAGTDPRWSEQLETELSRAPTKLSAVVDLPPMTLGALAALRAGQVLALPGDAVNNVWLFCEGRSLFRCDLGQTGGMLTVRIAEADDRPPPRKDLGLAS